MTAVSWLAANAAHVPSVACRPEPGIEVVSQKPETKDTAVNVSKLVALVAKDEEF
jgi:hypothetical protein